MIAQAREALAALREAAVIVLIATVVLFPSEFGRWLHGRGVTKVDVGGVSIDMGQFAGKREALNVITQQAENPALSDDVRDKLLELSRPVTAAVAQQAAALQRAEPGAVPTQGWIYLGTLDAARTRFLYSSYVRAPWPIKPGDRVTTRTDVNLRAESLPEDRPRARILSAVPAGATVTVLEVDASRAVVPGKGDPEPGWRVWVRVDVAARGS